MGVMDEAIQDGVSQGGIADGVVPVLDRELAGDDGGAAAMAIFEDFQQIASLRWGEDGQTPVVQDQKVQFGDGLEHAGVASVTPGQGEGLEETWDAVIDDAAPVPTGFVTQGAGNPAFAEAGLTGDQQVLMAIDPAAVDQMRHDGAVEATWGAQIKILDAGGLPEGGELQAGGQALGVALGGLAIDQEAEALFEAKRLEGWAGAALLVQRAGHSGQAERGEALGSGVGQHQSSPCQW